MPPPLLLPIPLHETSSPFPPFALFPPFAPLPPLPPPSPPQADPHAMDVKHAKAIDVAKDGAIKVRGREGGGGGEGGGKLLTARCSAMCFPLDAAASVPLPARLYFSLGPALRAPLALLPARPS